VICVTARGLPREQDCCWRRRQRTVTVTAPAVTAIAPAPSKVHYFLTSSHRLAGWLLADFRQNQAAGKVSHFQEAGAQMRRS
jgi:hypothetical protein